MAAHLFRENSGKITAVLTRLFGIHQVDRVTDIVQDTFESALNQWKFSGVPDNPAGWLMQVARYKAINFFKREGRTTLVSSFLKDEEAGTEMDIEHLFLPQQVEDSQLRLLLLCCHPDFSEKNQVMITLNILCGFGVAEIARALLMQDEAVKKALFRTRSELKEKKNILQTSLPLKSESRVSTAQTILYLMFNEGYKTTRSAEVINNDLCYEAIRLTKLLTREGVALIAETNALLALMFFNLSRFPARVTESGELVTLEEQDRSKWNTVFVKEGYYYLEKARSGSSLNRYYLEALIASVHCVAGSFEKTDWKTIVYLYEQLEKIAPSPMVTLNKLVAASYMGNPEKGLLELEKLKQEPAIRQHFLLYTAEGDMQRRSGNNEQARSAFRKAMELASSPLDRHFLERKIQMLSE